MLSALDYGIIAAYFVIVMGIGVYMTKRASGSIDEYFLGGRSLNWFILGLSGMATYIDMSGTMLQTAFFYLFGAKGFWICFRGAIPLILIFLMLFMGKWLRRSGVMTNAEWMMFRFGKGVQGQLARILSAVSILIAGVAMAAFFFSGAGKFLSMYFPMFTPIQCSLIMFGIVMVYTVSAGFYGVVFTDIFQGILIIGVIIFVVFKAMTIGTPEYFAEFAPAGWCDLALNSMTLEMPAGYKNLTEIGVLLIFWIGSFFILGFAIPHDAWTSQKYYAAKSERESSLVAAWWTIVFSVRFFLFMGLGILAIGISSEISEPEMALPAVINHYMPSGLRGMFIAALIAAAMSSLEAFTNSSAAYFVKDIYKGYLNRKASNKNLVKVSYITTASIMFLGILLGWKVRNISAIWGWICMGLFTGLIVPNIFKWYWWRFNGVGFACGMASGIISSIVQGRIFEPGTAEYIPFLFIIAAGFVGTVIGTFLGKPTDMKTLIEFYTRTRPFGFWGPVARQCDAQMVAGAKKENSRALWLLVPACVWMSTMYWTACAFVLKKWTSFGVSVLIVAVLSAILYKYWYLNLQTKEEAKAAMAAEAAIAAEAAMAVESS